MPSIELLRELNMNASEWGQLPSETESPIRNILKEKAARRVLSKRLMRKGHFIKALRMLWKGR